MRTEPRYKCINGDTYKDGILIERYQPPEGCDDWTEEQWQDHFKRKQEIIDGFKQLRDMFSIYKRDKNG
jgi:hypothetical protein